MPLFGHSDKNTIENQPGYPASTTQIPGQTVPGQTVPGQTLPGQTAPGQGAGIGHQHHTAGTGAGAGQFGQHNHTVSPAGNQSEYPVALSGDAQGAGHVPYRAEEAASNNYTQQQTAQLGQNAHHHTGAAGLGGAGAGATGTGTHTNGAHTNGTHSNGTTHSGGSAVVTEIVGKIEHAVGSLVHSTALKEKGIMKEQQAASMKAEAHETNRAEALEQEAINARQRAAGHGANADIGKAVPAAPAGTYAGNGGAMPGVMPAGPNTGGHSLI